MRDVPRQRPGAPRAPGATRRLRCGRLSRTAVSLRLALGKSGSAPGANRVQLDLGQEFERPRAQLRTDEHQLRVQLRRREFRRRRIHGGAARNEPHNGGPW
jgi:hypothetical protein